MEPLIKAVIIPDRISLNLEDKTLKDASTLLALSTAFLNHRTFLPFDPIGLLKT